MGMLVNPFGSVGGLEFDRTLDVNTINFPESQHTVTVNDDIEYGTVSGMLFIKKHRTEMSASGYYSVFLSPTVSSAGLQNDVYNGLPNEFYIEVDRPSILWLPKNFCRMEIHEVFNTTPISITTWDADTKKYTMSKFRLYVDGKDIFNDNLEINPSAELDSGKANLINGGGNYYTERLDTNTRILKSGTEVAGGNTSFPNMIYFNKSILIRMGMYSQIKTPKTSSQTATAMDYVMHGLITQLSGKVIQYK